jgi:hypothetical protein
LAINLFNTIDFRAMPEWFVLILGMLPFGFSAAALWMGVVLLHRRPFDSLLTAANSFRWRYCSFLGQPGLAYLP